MAVPTRIMDAHQHVFWHGRDDEGLVADMDQQGIHKAVLLNWDIADFEGDAGYDRSFNPIHAWPDRLHPGLPLADIVTAVRRFPDRFIVGYCPHPAGRNCIERLDSAVNMYNVKVCGEWKCRLTLDDPRCIELFRYCGDKRLPVVFHIDVPWLIDPATGKPRYVKDWYGGTVANLEVALRACPQTILVGHGPGFWREMGADADTAAEGYPPGPLTDRGRLYRLFDTYPNLYADLSGFSGLNAISRTPAVGKEFLIRYRQRLLFARDDYGGKLAEFLKTLDLPAETAEDVYHGNIERLLGM